MSVGEFLRHLRTERGLGLKALAHRVGVNHAYLARIEKGAVEPSQGVLEQLAVHLGADVDELMISARRLPPDVQAILRDRPREATAILRRHLGPAVEPGVPPELVAGGLVACEAAVPYGPGPGAGADVEDIGKALAATAARAHSVRMQPAARKSLDAWKRRFPHLADDEESFVLASAAAALATRVVALAHPSWAEAAHSVASLVPFDWIDAELGLRGPSPRLESVSRTWRSFESAYARLTSSETGRRWGRVYTPPEVVEYILDAVGFDGRSRAGCLLDPAAGCGAFLLAAGERIVRSAVHEPDAANAVVERLIGFDNDPAAVVLTGLGIITLAASSGADPKTVPVPRVFCTDTLEIGAQGALFREQEESVVEQIKTRAGDFRGGLRWIVGNPPYGKVHSSDPRVQQFAETVYGHANIYALFIHFCLDRLADDGRFGFIVPKSFASGLYFKKLRAYLLDHLAIEEVVTFGSRKRVFSDADVLQETVILVGRRGRTAGTIRLREPETHADLHTAQVVSVPAAKMDLGEPYDHVLCLTASQDAHEILSAVRERSAPLESFGLRASTGKLVWNRLKAHLTDKEGPGTLPLYWMHNVRPYRFLPEQRNGTRYRFARLNASTRPWLNDPEELVLTKRISAKEQARRLEAAHVPATWRAGTPGYFLENHLNFIARRADCEFDLVVLTALLNSKLLDYIFRIFNGNTQVSASELNMLPLPRDAPDRSLVKLAQRVVGGRGEISADIERSLNDRVYEAYGLTPSMIAVVEAFFADLGR
jgi:adenine-specific DNA-methyltransferase